jgi:hypothetical protein
MGFQSLRSNVTGINNVSIGHKAMFDNTFGDDVVAVGFKALENNTDGTDNVGIGSNALYANTTGDFNTAIGSNSLGFNFTGNYLTSLGYHADVIAAGLTHATAIGAEAEVGCSNCLSLGGTGSASTFVGINNTNPQTDLHIRQKNTSGNTRGIKLSRSGSNIFWRTYIDATDYLCFEYNDWGASSLGYITTNGQFISGSDVRIKKDITPVKDALTNVKKLNPTSFHYTNQDSTDKLHYGFIAQEVEAIYPDLVYTKEDGIKGIAYQEFASIAIKAIQEQQQQIETQQAQIDALQQQVNALLALNAKK